MRALVRTGTSTADAPMLTRLCHAVVDDLRMSGAVVSLMTATCAEREESGAIAAASSDQARAVDELEFSLGEGPARDAFLSSRVILTPDLEGAFDRWPGYVPAALDAGVQATFAFPLLVGAARFGVLHLHSAQVRSLSQQEIATSLLMTELATEVVLDALAPVLEPPPTHDLPLLGTADRRAQIYQAQGMVMVDLDIGLPEALARMRAQAFASGQDLADLAADILTGRVRMQRDPDGAP